MWELILGFPVGTYVKYRFKNSKFWQHGYIVDSSPNRIEHPWIRFFVRKNGLTQAIFYEDEVHYAKVRGK